MKRCPECRRDYYDDTLLYCLDDGTRLLDGPSDRGRVDDGPVTAILPSSIPAAEAPTRLQNIQEGPAAVLPGGPDVSGNRFRGFDKRWIAAPIVAALLAVGSYVGYQYFVSSSRNIDSIAVLPFSDSAGDVDSAFLEDGLAEELINTFTRMPDLKVAGRSTSFSFRGREGEPREIGRALGVASILSGRIFRRGELLSIQVDLISTVDGSQIWGSRYEGTADDIARIQQQIASDIAVRLRLNLSSAESQKIARSFTNNSVAYQHYLRGRYYWNRRTAENVRKAVAEFQRSVDNDPGFPLAYVGLADSYVLMPEYVGTPTGDYLVKAKASAQRALSLDDSLGEAHAVLGWISSTEWNWESAETQFKKAIELSPNYPTARHWYHNYLRETGQYEKALSEIKRAVELDPLSGIIGANLGMTYMLNGDFDSSIAQLEKVIDLDPNFWASYFWLGIVYLKQGRDEEAHIQIQKANELSNRLSRTLALYGYSSAKTGRRNEALSVLDELKQRTERGESLGFNIPMVYTGLGDKDNAFAWLEKAMEARSSELPRIRFYVTFDPIRSDPRYKDLLKRMNLPE